MALNPSNSSNLEQPALKGLITRRIALQSAAETCTTIVKAHVLEASVWPLPTPFARPIYTVNCAMELTVDVISASGPSISDVT